MDSRTSGIGFTCIFLILVIITAVNAEDWPAYQHDSYRSGVTSEHLAFPIDEIWRYTSKHEPRPAWPDPAKADIWHQIKSLKPRVTFDRAFCMVAVGDTVYFGSSADDKLYALNASNGALIWSFFAEGPIRLVPTVFDGKVYFGSDDGYVYCLDGTDGKVIWKYRPALKDRRIIGNSRMISALPVRTGVLVKDNIAYFGAGLFPEEKVYICAVNAQNGSEIWVKDQLNFWKKFNQNNISPQGYLMASETRLYVPNGRTAPVSFIRANGEMLGAIKCPSLENGTYALLKNSTSAPGTNNTDDVDEIATSTGRILIVTDEVSYILTDNEIAAVDRAMYSIAREKRERLMKEHEELTAKIAEIRERRKTLKESALDELDRQLDEAVAKASDIGSELENLQNVEYRWRIKNPDTYSMILTNDALIVGGDGEIHALNISNGDRIWAGKVTGKAYSLAAANGCLFASTDKGVIHCFGSGRKTGILDNTDNKDDVYPYPQDEMTNVYASAVKHILDETGIKKGYCLVLSCGEGRMAYELAKQTDLQIIGIDEDEKKVAFARSALDRTGLYGVRVTVHHGSLKKLPYTDFFANLIVSDGLLTSNDVPVSAKELFRVMRPFGGVAYLGQTTESAEHGNKLDISTLTDWLKNLPSEAVKIVTQDGLWIKITRGSLDGSGEWTHQYADPGNTACSGDSLVRYPLQVQWFGNPGPRSMVDRHHRAFAPLWKNGRLFIPAAGDNRIISVDAYNGTILWDIEVPNYRRVGANRDCGNMVVTNDYLYLAAEDNCRVLDVETGRLISTFEIPDPASGQLYWGYIATTENLLFGTGQKKEAARTRLEINTVNELYYDNKPCVISDYLFCMDRYSGKGIWFYKSGSIINPAITIGDKHIYFIESRNPKVIDQNNGKAALRELLESGYGYLVALDKENGNKAWERQIDFPFENIIHLCYANDILLAVGSRNDGNKPRYDLYAFADGDNIWQNHYVRINDGINSGHGEQEQHPVIVGNSIYMLESCDYNLQSGEIGTYKLTRGGHGCGTLSGSRSYLFARGDNPRIYSIYKNTDKPESGLPLTLVSRPGCWINIIPAGGLVLIPEYSSGCTCPYPIQTSIALIPRDAD